MDAVIQATNANALYFNKMPKLAVPYKARQQARQRYETIHYYIVKFFNPCRLPKRA